MKVGRDVQVAIDRLYATFASYERPTVMHASSLRDPGAILESIKITPLRELSEDQIGMYSTWAMTTVGSAEDYKHFLPRILELTVDAQTGFLGLDSEMAARKLQYGAFAEWPQIEQESIRSYFHAVWRQAREEHPNEADATGWLRATAIMGLDTAGLLKGWESSTSVGAMIQIASLAGDVLYLGHDERDLWRDIEPGVFETIVSWLRSERVQTTLVRASVLVEEEDRWWFNRALAKG